MSHTTTTQVEPLIRATDAADRLAVCRRTCVRLLRSGQLRGHQIRNRWYTTETALRDFLEATATRPSPRDLERHHAATSHLLAKEFGL